MCIDIGHVCPGENTLTTKFDGHKEFVVVVGRLFSVGSNPVCGFEVWDFWRVGSSILVWKGSNFGEVWAFWRCRKGFEVQFLRDDPYVQKSLKFGLHIKLEAI